MALYTPFFDPEKTYEENFEQGPFGNFADGKIFHQKDKPQYEIYGQKVFLPFGIPAGPLLNGKYVKAALDKGFDVAVYKTVRTRKYSVNTWPNVVSVKVTGNLTLDLVEKGVIGSHTYKEPIAITNSFGVPSFDPSFWQKDMAETVKYAKEGQLVIGGFQGTVGSSGNAEEYIKDFVKASKMVKETGAKVLEANFSCPNEGTSNLLCFDLERSQKTAFAIKNEVGNTPLIIKIAYFPEQKQFEKFVTMLGKIVDGIGTINSIPAKIINKKGDQMLPGGPGRLKAGVCGYPIKWAGIDSVKQLKILREKLNFNFKIFGSGGVTTPEDYNEYISAGADAVMSATGAMWNPFLAQETKKMINDKG